MRRTTKTGGFSIIPMALLAGAVTFFAQPTTCAAETLEADLKAVDAPTGRVSDRSVGYLRLTPGSKDKTVDILVQILNLPQVESEEAKKTDTSGHTEYLHALRLLPSGDCSSIKVDATAKALPEVGVRSDGSATETLTVTGFSLSDFLGKPIVMLTGADPKKPLVMACGVVKKD
ncbi:MAG: hypothetical protein FJ144_10360 [Deltaproteobacteria bacterium]|nr:hypothetical protein [Deltaproteobacteria bacterium]